MAVRVICFHHGYLRTLPRHAKSGPTYGAKFDLKAWREARTAQKAFAPRAHHRRLPVESRTHSMADAANKYPQNVSGQFYVDDQCIDCDLCRETAPANFTRSDDGGHSYVFKQPENDEETKLCDEAMAGCPVEAIGSDG
jgi:ferredoxin